jgi:hypothetical protein
MSSRRPAFLIHGDVETEFDGASVAFEQQLSMRKSSARPCFGGKPQANDGSSTL